MFKWFTRLIVLFFVPISGILSCAPDKAVVDKFNPPTPLVVHETEIRSIDALAQKDTERNILLDDRFDFSKTGAASVLIDTSCEIEKNVYSGHYTVRSQTVGVFDVVPLKIETSNLEKLGATCGFVFHLYNSVGSEHDFNLATVRIGRENTADVLIFKFQLGEPLEIDGDSISNFRVPPANKIWNSLQLNHIGARTLHSYRDATAALVCSDFRSPNISFINLVYLSSFDLSKGNFVDTNQICRVAVKVEDEPSIFSGSFPLKLQERKSELKLIAKNYNEDGTWRPFQASNYIPPYRIITWRYKNTSGSPHSISLPTLPDVDMVCITGYTSFDCGGPLATRWLVWQSSKSTLTANPGETIDLTFIDKFDWREEVHRMNQLQFIIKHQPTMTEYNEWHEPIDTIELNFPKVFFVNH